MKNDLSYYPLTAAPFKKNSSYMELAPCDTLQSTVRCFWGTKQSMTQTCHENAPEIVIPDTCADIIYHIDFTDQTVTGGFYGVNDHSFYAYKKEKEGHTEATFAIRFYAWRAYSFAEDSLKFTVNGCFEVGSRFEWLDRELRPKLLELKTLRERASFAEQLLLKRLSNVKEHKVVNHAMHNILVHKGALEVSGLAGESFVSTRQLERLFHEYIGITPKKLSNLIRYQLLWRDILCEPEFDMFNAVYKYGYTDQSHLMREFKRYHSMDIHSARAAAFRYVENIQAVSYGIR